MWFNVACTNILGQKDSRAFCSNVYQDTCLWLVTTAGDDDGMQAPISGQLYPNRVSFIPRELCNKKTKKTDIIHMVQSAEAHYPQI